MMPEFRVPSRTGVCRCTRTALADKRVMGVPGRPMWLPCCAEHLGRPVRDLPHGRVGIQWELWDVVTLADDLSLSDSLDPPVTHSEVSP